ncbi:MAG: hypothetical protein CMP21_08200 [Rickettsiales bacterium]|nr:hypothetical protein [Rickettsiales bacterium]|tara:strand:+ start:275 stop:850 length:576 start_codon:yes stop_codon:yes gene_type:complete
MRSFKHKEYIFSATLFSIIFLIFLIHFFLVQTTYLSPWSGGGFGMFSYLSGIDRQIHIHLIGDKTYYAILPPEKYKTFLNIRRFPRKSKLNTLLQEFQKRTWVISKDSNNPQMLDNTITPMKTEYFQNTFHHYFSSTVSGANIQHDPSASIPEDYTKVDFNHIEIIIYQPIFDYKNKQYYVKELIRASSKS